MFIDFRGKRMGGWEGERNIDQLPPIRTPTGDQTHNLGMCPDQESNPQAFGVQDSAPMHWATQPGPSRRNS